MSEINLFKDLAYYSQDYYIFLSKNSKDIKSAILIREVENSFLGLFNKGKMNVTI
jgi:hypothetical protein